MTNGEKKEDEDDESEWKEGNTSNDVIIEELKMHRFTSGYSSGKFTVIPHLALVLSFSTATNYNSCIIADFQIGQCSER